MCKGQQISGIESTHVTTIRSSLFLEDLFFWSKYQKRGRDGVGHCFSLKRVKRLKANHRSLPLKWFGFAAEN